MTDAPLLTEDIDGVLSIKLEPARAQERADARAHRDAAVHARQRGRRYPRGGDLGQRRDVLLGVDLNDPAILDGPPFAEVLHGLARADPGVRQAGDRQPCRATHTGPGCHWHWRRTSASSLRMRNCARRTSASGASPAAATRSCCPASSAPAKRCACCGRAIRSAANTHLPSASPTNWPTILPPPRWSWPARSPRRTRAPSRRPSERCTRPRRWHGTSALERSIELALLQHSTVEGTTPQGRAATVNSLASMLVPKSIAIVGASRKRTGPTGMLLDLVAEYPSTPPICIVNPSGESIDDLPTYRTVAEMPNAVDLARCWCRRPRPKPRPVNARREASPTSQSSARGSPTIATTPARDVRRRSRRWVPRPACAFSGPNSQGFMNLVDGVPATFSPAVMPSALARYFDGDRVTALERARGNVAIVTHSGGMGFALFNRGVARGVGFSYVISTGNEVDVEVTDCLEFLLEDSHTDVVMMYLEGLQRPERFAALAAPRTGCGHATRGRETRTLGRRGARRAFAYRSSRRRRPRLRRGVPPLWRGPCERSRRDARHGGRVVVVPAGARSWGRRRQCVGRFGGVAGRLAWPTPVSTSPSCIATRNSSSRRNCRRSCRSSIRSTSPAPWPRARPRYCGQWPTIPRSTSWCCRPPSPTSLAWRVTVTRSLRRPRTARYPPSCTAIPSLRP